MFGMNPAVVKTYLYPMAQHLRDHLLNFYLTQAHEAVQRAEEQKLITDDAQQQVQVIIRVQQIIEQQLAQFAQELAQIDKMAEQYAPQPQMPPDNSMQIAQMSAQIQQAALDQRAQSDAGRLQIDQQKAAQAAQVDQVNAQMDAANLADKQRARSENFQAEQLRQTAENERTQAEIDSRLQMNQEDNATAMRLAAAEIATGEKFSVSTGTGINPGTR
jgi:hypothetical protein